ncbi:MAG: Translocation protein S62 [Alyxoria varia]|nr:MAG: Translocation protein S62 [Alyxoria varia]
MSSPSPFPPGQQPTPQQIQQLQQQFHTEAARQGLTPQQLAEKLRAHAQQQQQQQKEQQKEQNEGEEEDDDDEEDGPSTKPQQQQVAIQPGPAKPEALALAKFLKGQELKSRPCILQEKRREMFKVKRAMRALMSETYQTARKKTPALPEVHDRASAENAFKLLPLSMLAIRVSRDESENPPHGQPGHKHGAGGGGGGKGQKKNENAKKGGIWTVRVEQHQDASDHLHYVWFYEGSQWRQRAYAVAALLGVITIVLFPLWPLVLRQGVWYLSMACLGLLGAFFGLAIVRLILFVLTVAVGPKPGLWLYPNLFEDVGFFDSFRPVWDWRETKESLAQKKADKRAKKKAKREQRLAKASGKSTTNVSSNGSTDGAAETTGADVGGSGGGGEVQRRNLSARVEEVGDEDSD